MPIYCRRGRLFFDFKYQGIRCREYTKLKDTPQNKRRMQVMMDRIEAEILLSTFNYKKYFPNSSNLEKFITIENKRVELVDGIPLFKNFAEVWFTENEIGWKHSYKETVRNSLDKHVIPFFGEFPVSKIKKVDILNFRTALANFRRPSGQVGLSPARINHVMTSLRMIINEAADRFEFETPWKGIKQLKVPKTQIEPFTFDEVKLILENVRPDYRNYYTVRFFTGMRTGEIHGLKWKYIDFERSQILIRESFVNNQMTTTKTDGSAREILMAEPVFEALKAQYEVTSNEEFVFCNKVGKPISVQNITKRVWYPLLRYLNLTKRRPYQARHTAATLWLASGESPEWIARQMGHTSTEMLFTVYSRYVPNLTRQDGSAFAALLDSKLNN